jgi:ABC-2 type transport system ATP-binding protein/lipopolysaccharide transport system ATP-binding protein
MAAIALEHVSVDFPIYGASSRSFKKRLLSMGSGGRISRDAKERVTVHALRDVTLRIAEGDRVGVIGPNGAGKSTLLRTVAGIYEPTAGRVLVGGRITTLFSLNVGIEQEATGFENITLRGLAAGMSRREIEQRAANIADFTELGEHLNLPLHTYSTGMRARLAFAIATAVEPDILLMDEWIGAGDAAFIEKARKRLQAVVDSARVLVLASHNEGLLKRVCNRIIELDGGQVRRTGNTETVLHSERKTPAPRGMS